MNDDQKNPDNPVEELSNPVDQQSVQPPQETQPPTTVDTSPESADTTTLPQPTSPVTSHKSNKRLLIIAAVVVVVAAIGITVLWALTAPRDDSEQPVSEAGITIANIGVAPTVIDGTVEYKSGNADWAPLTSEIDLKPDDEIRTRSDGRVVLTLDDGSAIRANHNTQLTLSRLTTDFVRINQTSGEIYARVVESDRSFIVSSEAASYRALGTAFKTIMSDTTAGVEVYQSKVSVTTNEQEVSEGKQYYVKSSNSDVAQKVTDIPRDQLQKDEFLRWNLEKDKAASEFKDKLGYFKTLEESSANQSQPAPQPVQQPTASSGIVLSAQRTDTGVKLTWSVYGISAPKGFKIARGSSPNPSYGSQDAAYVSDAGARSYTWKLKDGKVHHFRVCVYTGNSCTNYSNNVSVEAPLYVAPNPTGSLQLSLAGGKSVSWTIDGSAPYGLKLVWSTSENPVYPGSTSAAYGGKNGTASVSGSPGQQIYVRICMVTAEKSCTNYSNQVVVTIP